MGSLINSKPWVPYLNVKDCSQGFCSLYCPQRCYTIFPPPPSIELPNENQSPNFSPLIIAIILILASGFLIVSYYAIISKYFGNNNSSTIRVDQHTNEDPLSLEPWHVANNGLNETVIRSIAVYNYKREHNLIEGTDCSVCLSEFEEDESLRLLPNCTHAFHVACIDTWFKSHSNCPLCRANIVYIPPLPPPALENDAIIEDINPGTIRGEEILHNDEISKEENKEVVIEIRDEKFKQVRRSLSMDFDCGERLSIGGVLLLNKDYCSGNDGVGSSKGKLSDINKLSKGMGLFVDNPGLMKRSFSSDRFSFPRRSKQRIMLIP